MKNMKKIGALVLALVMVLSLSAMALAEGEADMTDESGVIGEFATPDTPTTQNDAVKIYKEITAYNPESCTVNAPTITYNYTIGAATVADGTTITDNALHHNKINDADVQASVAVKAGVGTPTITGTAAGVLAITTADQLSASQYGTANRFALTVSFANIFKTVTSDSTTAKYSAGVYRYVIAETTTAETKKAAGIAEGTVAKTLYMDVYVDGSGNIYGYTLFTDNESIDATTSDAAAATAAGKTECFVDDPADTVYTSENASAADKYYTFNLTLTKAVVNDSYAVSTHHQFPFTVTLTNSTVTANVLPIMTVSANATQTALTAAPIAGTWTPTIADSATVTYVGIPCGTTITVYETNDVVGVSYNSVSTNADTNAAAKSINTGDNSNTATINCNATALIAATENHTAAASKGVTFTNTLNQISPTGSVVRIAPYALMLAAGIVLFILMRRRREDAAEA